MVSITEKVYLINNGNEVGSMGSVGSRGSRGSGNDRGITSLKRIKEEEDIVGNDDRDD